VSYTIKHKAIQESLHKHKHVRFRISTFYWTTKT